MKSIIRWAVDNSPAVNTVMIGLILVGATCLGTMRREVFPEFDLEIILVTVAYPGASPAEVEQGICQKVEEAVRSVDGIKKQTAVAQEGAGFLVLELYSFVDVQKTLNEVRSEIDRIPSFPDLAEDPEIKQITLREPAIRVGIIGPDHTGTEAELELREIVEKIRNDLLLLPTVSQATIQGERPYQIDIEIPEDRLREYGLSLRQVAARVRQENLEMPGGRMKTDTEEVLLRGKDKRLRGDEIAQLPLVTDESGVVLTVGDLGVVRDAFQDITAVTRIDGKPGMVVTVDRTSKEDLLKIVDEVKQFVTEKANMPVGYELITFGDKSVEVRDRMNLLIKNGLQGLLLVFLMLTIFMDLRLSFWVAMGIPIAVCGSGVFLMYFGQTLNMLSMFAFLMALGIVVDDAIVIGENIFAHRNTANHANAEDAAVEGTYEVIPSVTASVCTTIIAFAPLLFVSGVMGKFIAVMPVAVIAMLVISLFESTIILPCHLAHSGGKNIFIRIYQSFAELPLWIQLLGGEFLTATAMSMIYATRSIVVWVIAGYLMTIVISYPLLRGVDLLQFIQHTVDRSLSWFIQVWYAPTLNWCIRHPLAVICTTLAFGTASLGLVVSGITPFIIFPKTDTIEIEARIAFPDGTPAHVTDRATKQIMKSIRDIDGEYALSHDSFLKTSRRLVGEISGGGPLGPDTRTAGSHVGSVMLELVDSSQRDIKSDEILELWRAETGDIPGAESLTFGSVAVGPGGTPIEFKLLAESEHMEVLEEAVEKTKARLAEYKGIVDIRDDSRPGKWEFQITVKDKAKSLGITLSDIAQTVRSSYYGEEVMRLQRGRHEVKLMVRYPPAERGSLARFQEIRVRAMDGTEYPLMELAEVNVERGYSEINRVDQLRSITISADVREDVGNAKASVDDLRKNFMPGLLLEHPNVRVRWEGQQEQTAESVQSMLIGLMIAVLAMFVLLTVEFRSYLQPLIILFIIPFGIVGAVWGHFFMGLPLTIFTVFGIVALTGVVVNDSIVLVDFINHRYRAGVPLYPALVQASCRRFRPVLLTSVTTIAGLFPLLLEKSFQAQFLIPLAATLVFGLLVSTGLVLVLIPTYYAVYRRVANARDPREEHDVTVPESILDVKVPMADAVTAI